MPFAKTAYLAQGGTARSNGSSGEGIIHFGAVRMRLTGQGTLQMQLNSLDDIQTQDLLPFSIFTATNVQPTRLSNFNEQRASLTVYSTNMNDYFRINRIIVFTKPIYSSYPGTS